jgi:hypothetical protein
MTADYIGPFISSMSTTSRRIPLSIKKEVKQFIIASERLYKLFSDGEQLNCHETEILNCCLDELAKRRLVNLDQLQRNKRTATRRN